MNSVGGKYRGACQAEVTLENQAVVDSFCKHCQYPQMDRDKDLEFPLICCIEVDDMIVLIQNVIGLPQLYISQCTKIND